jgi:hypothetical protein
MDPKQLREILKEELAPIIETQQQHTKILGEHSQLLGEHSQLLNEHSDKLDSLTAELHQVHTLANATLDIVSARYEKNKREIDEIKDHLGMTKEPYFGE